MPCDLIVDINDDNAYRELAGAPGSTSVIAILRQLLGAICLPVWTVGLWPRALLLVDRRSSWSVNISPLWDLQKQPGRAPQRGQPIRKGSRVSIRMFRSHALSRRRLSMNCQRTVIFL